MRWPAGRASFRPLAVHPSPSASWPRPLAGALRWPSCSTSCWSSAPRTWSRPSSSFPLGTLSSGPRRPSLPLTRSPFHNTLARLTHTIAAPAPSLSQCLILLYTARHSHTTHLWLSWIIVRLCMLFVSLCIFYSLDIFKMLRDKIPPQAWSLAHWGLNARRTLAPQE